MTDQAIPDEAPEETEIYEQYDEVAEGGSTGADEDPGATGVTGAEGDLTRFTELPVDRAANEEIGAEFDDPERMAVLDGGMDDPDGIEPDTLTTDTLTTDTLDPEGPDPEGPDPD